VIDGIGGEGDDDGWGVILAVSFYFGWCERDEREQIQGYRVVMRGRAEWWWDIVMLVVILAPCPFGEAGLLDALGRVGMSTGLCGRVERRAFHDFSVLCVCR
jgi:hypothetical protein